MRPLFQKTPLGQSTRLTRRVRKLERRFTPQEVSGVPDFAWMGMLLGQTIAQSTVWSGTGYSETTIVMDNYLVAPGGPNTETSPSGAFSVDTSAKRIDLKRSGIYFLMVEVSETGEWLGLEDNYFWHLTTSGAGYIWNSDPTYQLNGFAADAPYAEWYKTLGPLIVWADDTHTVRTGFKVAQKKFSPAELSAFVTTWCYWPAMNFGPGMGITSSTLSDLMQTM